MHKQAQNNCRILVLLKQTILLAKNMSIGELVYYSDSLHCINLIKGSQVKYHIYAMLIQDINELFSQTNASPSHT
jgi:hypothetical protein